MTSIDIHNLEKLLDNPRREPPGVELLDGRPPLVLFGAGGRGRRILTGLRSIGILPAAFADNAAHLAGGAVDEITVLSANEAVRLHPQAVFIVTIWSDRVGHPFEAIRNQLAALGMERVASFTALYQKYPDVFFPDFFMDRIETILTAKHAIKAAAKLWFDAASNDEFFAQLAMRISLDFDQLQNGANISHPAYFPTDLFTLNKAETFVDCGAYDGDTYRDFVRISGNRFRRYIAIEPDAQNFDKLAIQTADAGEMRVRLLKAGVAEQACVLRFSAEGSTESRESQTGNSEVNCLTLDEILHDETPSYIKMDIEGAELGALRGAREILTKHRPILAVSAYHRVEDLWSVPALINDLVMDYALFLRPEKKAGWDLICYAVPRERLANALGSRQ